MNKVREGVCELCGRLATTLSEHHLIPRTTHRNRRVSRMFSAEEMRSRKADMCQPCTKAVHTFFANKELALEYNTLEALRAHPKIAAHIQWVRRQRPEAKTRRGGSDRRGRER